MKRLFQVLACVPVFAACGPDTAQRSAWMIGTFSNHRIDEKNVASVTYYEFSEDGMLSVSGVTAKGKDLPPATHAWTQESEDAVVVAISGGDSVTGDNWRFMPGTDCNQIGMQRLIGDSPQGSGVLVRGKVCIVPIEEPCPIGDACDASVARWCDGPPPACPGTEDLR